ncbi:MAG: phospholipase D-like domain-containing protein [Myxococcales bacterium]
MRRHAAALLLALSCTACFGIGRKPVGEVFLAPDAPDSGPDFANALFQTTAVRLEGGNTVEFINNGKVFDAVLSEIPKARSSIHIVTFIWSDGEESKQLMAAIAERARAGVQCRILVDAVGSLSFTDEQAAPMVKAGCEFHRFRPVPGQDDLARNHRKIVVVDGRVGITGGFGIDDRWRGDGLGSDGEAWRDSNVRVRGPAVLGMQQAFAENWQEATRKLLPVDAFPDPERPGKVRAAFVTSTEHGVVTRNDRLTQLFLAAAHERIWVANAYFLASEPILQLLERKAREGVDVRILAAGDKTDTTPYLGPQRERMDRLVAAGARAYEYEPTMMHGKTMLVDRSLVAVGSCNLDPLSLNKMDEGALVADDPELARQLERQWMQDLAHAKERGTPSRQVAKH